MSRPERLVRGTLLRANPLALMSVGFFSLVGGLFVRRVEIGVVALAFYVLVVVLVVPTWRYPVLCLSFALVAAATVTYSTWRGNGHELDRALIQGVRVVVIAWPGSVALGYLDPSSLGDHLAQSLRLPARFVAAFVAALQRITTLSHAWAQLDRSRRARGVGPEWRHPVAAVRWAVSMAFALLVHALRGAGRTAIAMDARGFATAQDRSWAEPADWSRTDVVVTVGGFLLGAVAPVVWAVT